MIAGGGSERVAAILAVLAAGAVAGTALGDGKFLPAPGRTAPELPWQRAIILHDPGDEARPAEQVLIVQSAGIASDPADAPAAPRTGWLLPIPATPTAIDTMDAGRFDGWWWNIRIDARPGVTDVSSMLQGGMLVVLLAAGVTSVACFVLAEVRHAGSATLERRRRYRRQGIATGAIALVGLLGSGALLPMVASAGVRDGVTVERHVRAGIHDVRVVAGDDAAAMVAYIAGAGFAVDEATAASIAAHVEQGWRFVLSELDLAGESVDPAAPDPLVLRFPTERPVYPLALTGTAGAATEVQVALVRPGTPGDGRLTDDEAHAAVPPIAFRGTATPRRFLQDRMLFALDADPGTPYLTGALEDWAWIPSPSVEPPPLVLELRHGILTPEDMATDLVFDSEVGPGFRRRIVRW